MTNKDKGTLSPIQSDQVGWDYEKVDQFFHCQHCFKEYEKVATTISPKDYFTYEVGSHPFTYKDGHTEGVVVVFCSMCKRMVWNSSHLRQRQDNEL